MEPDQGIRYELAGIVASTGVLVALKRVRMAATVVPLQVAGLGLAPVTPELAAAATPAMICALLGPGVNRAPQSTGQAAAQLYAGPESGFTHMTPGLLSLVEALSLEGPVGYLEADYVGRDGVQSAASWRDGELLLGPLLLSRSEVFVSRESPISTVLRHLGVPSRGPHDEFVVAGLGAHRRTADWIAEDTA
jgi:hypothetical protein